jgi:glycosyltransferase involved in cell wall biosynthesis
MNAGFSNLTAVVVCHDSDLYLQQALTSIRSQGSFSIVLVDDGSTKCTCDALASEFENLKHVKRPNGGYAAALNTGLQYVETDFVSFLDDDDEWLPGKVERHGGLLAQSQVDAVIGGVINVHEENGLEVGRQYFPAVRMLGAMTARIDAVRQIGGFTEHTRHHSIIDWWMRAMNAGFTRIDDPEPALMRRIHENNSGIVHRDQARRDLLHHLRTNVVRRREP